MVSSTTPPSNWALVVGFRANSAPQPNQNDPELLADFVATAGIAADEISVGDPGRKGAFSRKFRKSDKAMDFLRNLPDTGMWIGATQRSQPRGSWEVAAATIDPPAQKIALCFPSAGLRTDPRIPELIQALHGWGTHYAYVAQVESVVFGLFFSSGTSWGAMDSELTKNVHRAGHYMRSGGDFSEVLLDVFPINIISSRHLELRISEHRLETYISRYDLGVVAKLDGEMRLWRLSDEQLWRARRLLRGSGATVFV